MPFRLPFSSRPSSQGDAQQQSSDSPGSTSLKWKIILCISLLFPILLETLDYTVVATAQTNIASHFGRLDLQTYIGSVYLLTSTVFLPVFASLADIFGRHWALQISFIFFLVGSALSTGAQNMDMMLAGRGIAGVGAAGLITVVRVILADSRSLDDNNWQTTIMWFLYGIGFGIGPPIGGALVTVSFRWIFAINLPCAVLSMVLSFFLLRGRTKGGRPPRHLPETSEPLKETLTDRLLRVDWVGAVLFVAAGILLLLALNWGSSTVWKSARVIVCFVIGGILFIACIYWQYYLEKAQLSPAGVKNRILAVDPMIPLEALRSYNVCAVCFASFVEGSIMLVVMYFTSIFMTIVSGLSPTKAGVQLLYFIPGMGGGSLLSIHLIRRYRQPRNPIILSGLVFCIALGFLSSAIDNGKQSQINGFLAMSGAAVGLAAGSLPIQARFSQPDDKIAVVSALVIFARTFGGTVGLAQCAAVMNSKVSGFIISTYKAGQISQSEAAELVAIGTTSVHDITSFPENVQMIFREAFRSGTRWCFISLIPWCGVAFLLTLGLKKIPDTDRQPPVPTNDTLDSIAMDPVDKPASSIGKQNGSDDFIENNIPGPRTNTESVR